MQLKKRLASESSRTWHRSPLLPKTRVRASRVFAPRSRWRSIELTPSSHPGCARCRREIASGGAYCLNNPVKYTDPTGEFAIGPYAATGLVLITVGLALVGWAITALIDEEYELAAVAGVAGLADVAIGLSLAFPGLPGASVVLRALFSIAESFYVQKVVLLLACLLTGIAWQSARIRERKSTELLMLIAAFVCGVAATWSAPGPPPIGGIRDKVRDLAPVWRELYGTT